MREIRQSGSEGGGASLSLPLSGSGEFRYGLIGVRSRIRQYSGRQRTPELWRVQLRALKARTLASSATGSGEFRYGLISVCSRIR